MQLETVEICRHELADGAREPTESTHGRGRHSDGGIGRGASEGDCGG